MRLLLLTLAFTPLRPAMEQVAPNPETVLREMGSFYGGLRSFQADVTATYSFVKINFKTEYSLAMKRPNQLALVLRKSEEDGKVVFDGKKQHEGALVFGLDFICDGKNVYYYFSPASRKDVLDGQKEDSPTLPYGVPPMSKPVTRLKAPPDLEGVAKINTVLEWEIGFIHRNILELVRPKTEEGFATLKKEGTLKDSGVEEVNSVKCRRLTYEYAMTMPDWRAGEGAQKEMKSSTQWWIAEGPQPRLLKESIEMDFGKGAGYSMTITYANWRLNPTLSEADFKLPPGLEK